MRTVLLLLVFIFSLADMGTADSVISGAAYNLPANRGFTADCATWSAGESVVVGLWARNDDTGGPSTPLTLVHGAWYPIEVGAVDDYDNGFCITIDESSSGGYTRTLYIDQDHSSWFGPLIPENSGFYVNASGQTYANWRTDDREGYYDTGYSGFRLLELNPGILYENDIARWLRETYSALTSIVTVSP
jgi:hypothetical protein